MSDKNQTQMPTVNETIVKRIIEDALMKEQGATIVEKTYAAFRKLQERRRSKEWVNVELAAAEHYMYARSLAGSTGDPTAYLAPSTYYLKKCIFYGLDIQSWMETSEYPGLPPTKESLHWGEKGAMDGLRDFKSINPATDFQVGGAVEPLAKSSY